MPDYIVYSDGGSVQGEQGSSACIVEDCARGVRVKLVAFLATATNNEAEISAALIGLSLIRARIPNLNGASVRLTADSEYFLKGATEYIKNWQKNGWRTASRAPVKNQGLWRTFLVLSEGFKLEREHVRGHTGHPENEACDTACNWIREHTDELSPSKPTKLEITDGLDETTWWGLDSRTILAALREERPAESVSQSWCETLRKKD